MERGKPRTNHRGRTYRALRANTEKNKNMIEQPPPRYPTPRTSKILCDLLDLEYENGMQDWPLEVANAARLGEFCDAYEAGNSDDEVRFVLMELIVFSLDDWLAEGTETASETEPLPERVERLLMRDFPLHLHTVNYWRLDGETDDENVFHATPLMRRVWDARFLPEYNRWLEWFDRFDQDEPPQEAPNGS